MKICRIIFGIVVLLIASGCVTDKDFGTGSAPEGAVKAPRLRLESRSNDAVEPGADNTALTLMWSDENDGADIFVEMAADTLFVKTFSDETVPGTDLVEYTFREINDIMTEVLGMESGVQAQLYLRLKATVGDASAYSNIASVTATPGAVLSPVELTGYPEELYLTASAPESLALSLSWSSNGVGVTDAIEIGSEPEFMQPYSVEIKEGVRYRQFTNGELNTILVESLGYEANTKSVVYIRIVSSFETSAVYSNVLKINVTPQAQTLNDTKILYVCGLTQAEDWSFDEYLIQYNEKFDSYCNVHYVDSRWGFRFFPQKDNWDYTYSMASGNALSGTLRMGGSTNVPQPAPGLYFFDVSLGDYKYKLTSVKKVSCSGFNDDWNLIAMSPVGDSKTTYSATVTIRKPATYRWQVVLNDWEIKLCATGGHLLYDNEGEATDVIANGIYTLTVDLAKGVYSFEEK